MKGTFLPYNEPHKRGEIWTEQIASSIEGLSQKPTLVIDVQEIPFSLPSILASLLKRTSSHTLIKDTLSIKEEEQYRNRWTGIFDKIIIFATKANKRSEGYWSFTTEFKSPLHDINTIIKLMITPMSSDEHGKPINFLISTGLGLGLFLDKILATDYKKQELKVLEGHDRRWKNFTPPSLTSIEYKVLAISAQGLSVDQCAGKLYLARDSIKSIRKRIFDKLGVTNIASAISFLHTYNII